LAKSTWPIFGGAHLNTKQKHPLRIFFQTVSRVVSTERSFFSEHFDTNFMKIRPLEVEISLIEICKSGDFFQIWEAIKIVWEVPKAKISQILFFG